MSFPLIVLTKQNVIGFNDKAIKDARRKDPNCQETHRLIDEPKLEARLGSIFFRDSRGTYLNLPIEKIAGLILYRIAEGQCFENGNKRTAVLSSYFFLYNNGYDLQFKQDEMNELIWGFAQDPKDSLAPRKYNEDDAISFIEDRLVPRL
jgi:death-on-curing family protein